MFFSKKNKVPIEVSARHCHLSKEDLQKLFGSDYQLKKMRQLSQPSDFACEETVEIEFGSKSIKNVRVVGPLRGQTQVEISLSDAIGSGITPLVKTSGDLGGSTAVILRGPAGKTELEEGLIIAQRHIHCSTNEAKKLKLKDQGIVSVKIEGERSIIFNNVKVRVKDAYSLSMHIDTDEGNASGINKIGGGIIV
jgi:putative phosphotransacetylase